MDGETGFDIQLPRIEDLEVAASICRTAEDIARRLGAAAESAERFAKLFGRMPQPGLLLVGLEEVERSVGEALADVDEVYRGLGARRRVGGRVGPGRRSWDEIQRREWAAWGRHYHLASAATPAEPHLEKAEPGLTVVHLAGRRIGYLRDIRIGDPDKPGRGGIDGHEVLDPFKRAYKRPLYETLDEALARLVGESTPFLDADDGRRGTSGSGRGRGS